MQTRTPSLAPPRRDGRRGALSRAGRLSTDEDARPGPSRAAVRRVERHARAGAAIEPPTNRLEPTLDVPTAIVRGFALAVQEKMLAPGVLTYADRESLLRRARALGISRFDASLIVASVVNKPLPARREPTSVARPAWHPAKWIAPLLVFTTIQGSLAAAAWWVWTH
jgi:hypothetical protein